MMLFCFFESVALETIYEAVSIHFIQIYAFALFKSNSRSIRTDCLREGSNVARIAPKFLYENVAMCGLTDNADLRITPKKCWSFSQGG